MGDDEKMLGKLYPGSTKTDDKKTKLHLGHVNSLPLISRNKITNKNHFRPFNKHGKMAKKGLT